jgi:hypothetical protein
MTTQAWITLVLAWSVIIGMTFYCFYKLLTSPRRFGPHAEDEPPAP